ncbi:MAG: FecR domain-containing protein [Desulfobacterales bacterium]|nr:FecR domain-containing protein [Desulfobacterales bacterium]
MRKTYKVSIIVSCLALAIASICGPSAAAAAARGQGVTAAQLPEELRALTVQSQFIRGQGVPIGKVRKLRGHLIVRHGNSPEAYFAARGDNLYAHDELFTLNKSRVRVRFTTADIVNMGANSRIRVDELVDDRRNRQKKTRMSMLRGKAMFYVMRLFKYNKVDTSVTTPTAVCGVRGTKFGIIVRKKTDLWSSMPLYLADVSGTPLSYLLADNGGGGDTETDMLMEEGDGFMTAGGTTTPLGSGQTGTAGPTGPPSSGPTDPNQSRELNDETDPDGTGAGAGDGDGGGSDTGDAGTTGDDGGVDNTNRVTQHGLTSAGPTNRIGYFAAMVTRDYLGSSVDLAFLSDSLQDHEGPDIIGTDVSGGGDIELTGTPGGHPTVVSLDTDYDGTFPGGTAHQVQSQQVGINSFLVWGYWTMPVAMGSSSASYVIDNPGVFVHGDPTPVENLGGISGHYAGTAWGTYWTSSGGNAMSGTMSADVTVGSPDQVLSGLNVSVTGGGHTITILQTSPTDFDEPNGEFMLMDGYNADFKLDGGTSAYDGSARGGLFGTNGEALGGTAAMEFPSSKAVVGFEGTNQGPPVSPPVP